jgi:tetratricopeptide (TPR) repeat protein
MTLEEIRTMRKNGQLDEAVDQVEELIKTDPENIWVRRGAAWVYYDVAKAHATPATYGLFWNTLQKIIGLALPKEDTMLFDACAWQIGKMVMALQKEKAINYSNLDELYQVCQQLSITKPSDAYSFLIKAFLKAHRNWDAFLEFVDWWGFDQFCPQDFEEELYNGQKIMSLVEQVYIAYAKQLLNQIAKGTQINQDELFKEKMAIFMSGLDGLMAHHPEYKYTGYYKAKLLLAMGEGEDSLTAFLPFAKLKKQDFWVWELMAEIFNDKQDERFACLCKALSLKASDDYLINVRQLFAQLLIERKMFEEAKTEIKRIVDTRVKKGWSMPSSVTAWMQQPWFMAANERKDNRGLYEKYRATAEALLFMDMEEEVVAVSFVNPSKSMLNFIKDKHKQGFFNYAGFLKNPQVGEILVVRLLSVGSEGFFKLMTLRSGSDIDRVDSVKSFNGKASFNATKTACFVNDVYIEPKLVQAKEISPGQFVEGYALLSFNKSKNDWGWKAFKVNEAVSTNS